MREFFEGQVLSTHLHIPCSQINASTQQALKKKLSWKTSSEYYKQRGQVELVNTKAWKGCHNSNNLNVWLCSRCVFTNEVCSIVQIKPCSTEWLCNFRFGWLVGWFCVGGGGKNREYMQQRICGGQRTADNSQLFPSTMWVLATELISSANRGYPLSFLSGPMIVAQDILLILF